MCSWPGIGRWRGRRPTSRAAPLTLVLVVRHAGSTRKSALEARNSPSRADETTGWLGPQRNQPRRGPLVPWRVLAWTFTSSVSPSRVEKPGTN